MARKPSSAPEVAVTSERAVSVAMSERAVSVATARIDTTVAELFGADSGAARVLGRIAIRFSGETLASTQHVHELVNEAVRLVGKVGPVWARGTWNTPGARSEVNQGRDVLDRTGRALLESIFADVATMPQHEDDPALVDLVLSDGPRPERKRGIWTTGCRVAASFGVRVRLAAATDRPPGGLFEVYVPLADLDDRDRRETWVAFAARAFADLGGSAGTFGLGLWMEEIAPEKVPLALLTDLPAVALPQLVGRHAGGFDYPDFSPDLHHGLFEPCWITWLSPDLARRVTSFPGERREVAGGVELRIDDAPPLAMSDAIYMRYRDAWKALDAVRIRWKGSDVDDSEAWRYALDRFDAPSLGELRPFLRKRLEDGEQRVKLYWSSQHAARNGEGKRAFVEAERALDLGWDGVEIHETLLEGALCFGGAGMLDAAAARKALARVEALSAEERQQLALITAKVLLALTPGASSTALAWLDANAAAEPRPARIAFDSAFDAIADDDRFRRAAGWALESGIAKLCATPQLADAFPKLAKAIEASPGLAAFGAPASKRAIEAAERALGMQLPARYRTMLAAFDGATLRGGREILYASDALAAHNTGRKQGSVEPLAMGRNLLLHPGAIKNGEASITEPFHGVRAERTTLRWTTLDACLAALARGKHR